MQIDPKPLLSKIGGKAYQLCKLKQQCTIPPFFVITFENPEEIHEFTVQQVILEECKSRKFDLVAIRSSAGIEDSTQASFAGMFETVLSIQLEELINAISKVLDSVFTKRVADYCKVQGFNQSKIRMAVIVQKMIQSRVSGVCFTRLQNQTDSLMIEACYGLGEVLVSGKVTPDSYTVGRNTLSVISESIGYQKVLLKIIENKHKKLLYQEIPFHKRNARKLTYDEVKSIAKTCLTIEQNLHFEAADVEWALKENILYILQARPYTGFIS